jgi:hypothetical protein
MESIFHKLVKHEPSYTQLLCNILRRDEKFRKDFFGMKGISQTAPVKPEQIHVEKHLGEHGRADIWIRSTHLRMIVEIKTNLGRRLEESQLLVDDGKRKSYLDLLKKEAEEADVARIVYLAPRKWFYWDETDELIRVFNRRTDCSVRASLISWEEVTRLIPEPDQASPTISLAGDFRLLLSERFGPTTLTLEEVKIMLGSDFSVEIVLKLISLIHDISFELASKKKSAMQVEIGSWGYGFYVRTSKKQNSILYIGCWLQIWKITGSPVCFAMEGASEEERSAFARSLFSVYGQAPVPNEDGWIVGFVPEQDISGSEAVGSISGKIRKVFDSISQVERSNELSPIP